MFANGFHAEVHLSVAAREKFAALVGNVDFGIEGAAGEGDGVGGSNDFAPGGAGGILDKFERGRDARANVGGVDFRHANEGANWIGLGEIKERLASAAIAGVDEVSGIDVAVRKHA